MMLKSSGSDFGLIRPPRVAAKDEVTGWWFYALAIGLLALGSSFFFCRSKMPPRLVLLLDQMSLAHHVSALSYPALITRS